MFVLDYVILNCAYRLCITRTTWLGTVSLGLVTTFSCSDLVVGTGKRNLALPGPWRCRWARGSAPHTARSSALDTRWLALKVQQSLDWIKVYAPCRIHIDSSPRNNSYFSHSMTLHFCYGRKVFRMHVRRGEAAMCTNSKTFLNLECVVPADAYARQQRSRPPI